MTIVEFLEARIAEDEEWANGTAAQRAADQEARPLSLTVRQWLPKGLGKLHNDPWPLPGEPDRVLRECAAKRTILRVSDPSGSEVVALAAAYADHPDFDPAWGE